MTDTKLGPEEIAAIQRAEAAEAKAAPGPWETLAHGHPEAEWWSVHSTAGMPRQIARVMSLQRHDAHLIAALRNAAPALFASARRLVELQADVILSASGLLTTMAAIDVITNINQQLTAANARVVELEDALNRDRTELAAALGKIVDEVEGRGWIADGRGSYEWDDDRYRAEAGEGFAAVKKIAVDALVRSGTIANEVLMGRTPIAQKLRDERDAATQRAEAAEAKVAAALAALDALEKWDNAYGDLVEKSKRWVHDSTLWETSSYPELTEEWQALWNAYPKAALAAAKEMK